MLVYQRVSNLKGEPHGMIIQVLRPRIENMLSLSTSTRLVPQLVSYVGENCSNNSVYVGHHSSLS